MTAENEHACEAVDDISLAESSVLSAIVRAHTIACTHRNMRVAKHTEQAIYAFVDDLGERIKLKIRSGTK